MRGGRVATVPDDVDELASGKAPARNGMRRTFVGVFSAEAQVAVELDAEQPAIDEPEEPARAPIAPQALVDVAARGLRGRRLVVVADLRKAADAVAQEGRAGAGRADDEDGPPQSSARSRRRRVARSSAGAARASGSSAARRGTSSGRAPACRSRPIGDRLGPGITDARDVLAAWWEVVERGAFSRRRRGRGVRRSRERRGGGLVGRGRRHRLLSSGSGG